MQILKPLSLQVTLSETPNTIFNAKVVYVVPNNFDELQVSTLYANGDTKSSIVVSGISNFIFLEKDKDEAITGNGFATAVAYRG